MMTIIAKFLPILPVFAEPEIQQNDFINGILGWAAGIAAALVAGFLIYSLVKDALEYAKGSGSGSIFKIIGKVLFLIVMIGLIYYVVKFDSIGNTASSIGEKAISEINNQATSLLNKN